VCRPARRSGRESIAAKHCGQRHGVVNNNEKQANYYRSVKGLGLAVREQPITYSLPWL